MRYLILMILFGYITGFQAAAQYNSTTSDLNKNWIVVKTYKADGSVESISKQYFDNSGRTTQAQYRNFTSAQVLAAQVILDAYGRPAVHTLPAPINSSDFGYKDNFVTNTSGTAYTYQNFDDAKTNNPDPVGQSTAGTLGWYYSSNNSMESRVPESDYPYARADFYKDGTSTLKRSALAGSAFKMGSGHENAEFVYPSVGEFTNYLQVRSKYFPSSEVGLLGSTYRKSTLKVFRDANGNESFMMMDEKGRPMIVAKPGSDIQLNCSMSITADPRNSAYINANSQLFISPNAQIEVYVGQTLYYTGVASGWNVSALGAQNGMIRSASAFSYKDCGASGCSGITPAVPRPSVHYFKILADNTSVAILNVINGSYTLYDMATETPITLTGGVLNKGYYKVVANTGDVIIQYRNSYTDISYYFYNQLGQMIATVAPEGVKALINNINAYATKNDVPFMQLYEYDLRGKLIASTTPDGGRTEFIYRKDGLLRFSQNSKQQALGWFSYTNYDQYGRAIESGEYRPSGDVTFAGLKTNTAIIEDVSSNGGLPILSNKYEWVRTKYATEDNTHGLGYTQTYIRNSVSVTESPSSKTWYNYNEEGKLLWTIQGIKDYGSPGTWGYKVTEYVYDSEWRIAKILYQKNQADMFVYWYEYDADGRIEKVYTNTADNVGTRILQSKYAYYVHGPLKRTEIGGNLQGIDYTYTLHGLPKAINHSNKAYDPGQDGVPGSSNAGFMEDAYGMTLEYYNGDYARTGTNIGSISISSSDAPEQFTGIVRGMSWFSKKPASSPVPATPTMYVFKYDSRYQFREATWGTPQFPAHSFSAQPGVNKEIVSLYDMHGNIKNLSRTNSSGTTTDNFQYNYFSSPKPLNRLQQVTELSTSQAFATYQYDNLGQVTAELPGPADPGNTNKYLQYEVSGKVTGVYADAGFTIPIVKFVYNEVGERIKKLSYNSGGSLVSTTYYIYDGGRNLMSVYTQPNGGSIAQAEIPIWGGGDRIAVLMRNSNTYRYEMTDYLGNVRSVVIRNGSNLDVAVFRDYYPFGHPIPAREQTDADGYRYAYQGEYAEKDAETNWNAYELRMYNSRIGRWLSVDPYQQFFNPYLAVGNNPMNNVDPDGGWLHILVGAVVGAVVEGYKVVRDKGWKGLTTGEGITKVLYGAGSGALIAAAPGVTGAVLASGGTNIGGQIINNAFDPNKKLFDIDKSQVLFSAVTAGIGAKGGDMLRKPMANMLEKWGRSASNTLFIPGRGTYKFIEKAYRPWWYTERQGLSAAIANTATDPLNRWAEGYLNETWDNFENRLQRSFDFGPVYEMLPEIIIRARRLKDAIPILEEKWRRRAMGLE